MTNNKNKTAVEELDARLSAIEIRLEKMVASFDFHMQNIFDRTSCLEKSFDNHLYPPPPICLCEDVKLANDAGFIGDDIVCKIHPTNNMNPKPEKPTVELALMVLKQYKHEKCQDSESMTNELNCAIEILEKANGDGTK